MRHSKRVEFLRVLIAAAWADGAISYNEMNSLKDYFAHLELTDQEYADVSPYLEEVIEPTEASQIIEEFLVNAHKGERETLVAAVRDMLLVDGRMSSREEEFLSLFEDIARDVATANVFVASLKQVWRKLPAPEQTGRFARKDLLDEFYRNRVLYEVKRQLLDRSGSAELAPEMEAQLRRLCTIGALLGQMAQADESFDDDEKQKIVSLLHQNSELRRTDIEQLVDIIREEVRDGLDYLPFVREFAETASETDRADILELLFTVAGADGRIGDAESDQFQRLAKALGLSHRHFLAAKARAAQKPR